MRIHAFLNSHRIITEPALVHLVHKLNDEISSSYRRMRETKTAKIECSLDAQGRI